MDYNTIISKHLRRAVRDIIKQISIDSMSQNQQLWITFSTQYPGVKVPDHVAKTYPEEITILLQYEFENIEVFENHFSVSLVFDSDMERITVPFNALLHAEDPSNDLDLEIEPIGVYELEPENTNQEPDPNSSHKKGNIIQLDQFQD